MNSSTRRQGAAIPEALIQTDAAVSEVIRHALLPPQMPAGALMSCLSCPAFTILSVAAVTA